MTDESIYDGSDAMRELRAKLRADHEAELAADGAERSRTEHDGVDTREKLRDDAVDWLKDHFMCSTQIMSELDVWLDRQAAITEREWREHCASDECCGFQELVDANENLQAEHDDLKRANERQARKIREVCEANESLRAENRELRDKLDMLRLAVERAEAERGDGWMKLPVDADGIPIRVGDTLAYGDYSQGIVKAVGERMVVAMHVDDDNLNYAKYGLLWNADACRHVKERTVEDVLATFRFEASCVYDDPNIGGEDMVDALYALDEKYAAEIRELMGVER